MVFPGAFSVFAADRVEKKCVLTVLLEDCVGEEVRERSGRVGR